MSFNTYSGNTYIYDARTGCIFASDEILMDAIELFQDNSIDETRQKLLAKYENKDKIEGALSFISKITQKWNAFYKSDNDIRKEKRFIYNFNEEAIKICLYKLAQMSQLILSVTEDCNLKCKYCIFSETYSNTRNKTANVMSKDTAFSALDYFFDKMKDISYVHPGKICSITFYGGEPLLNFDLIKSCVEYTKNNCPVRYIFNITTNGTLLNGEIADYLIKNEFYISISLDGDKINHDRNRVFEGGIGSFERVYENLLILKKKYPEYDRLSLMSVYDYGTDLMRNQDFFKNNTLIPKLTFINQVLERNTDYYDQFNDEDIQRFVSEYGEIYRLYIENKKENLYEYSYASVMGDLGVAAVFLRQKAKDSRLPMIPYTGTCIPGMKISVRSDGNFEICERVGDDKIIGNIDEGIDYSKIVKIIQRYNEDVTKECACCPLYKACPVCYSFTSSSNGFEKMNCNNIIENFRAQLSISYSILESNPNAYDYFTNKLEWTLNR